MSNREFKCDECKEHDSENILNYNNVLYYLCEDCYDEHLKEESND